MKKLFWFTHTNIDTRNVQNYDFLGGDKPKVSTNLSDFIKIFLENKIWERGKYRIEYSDEYYKEDLKKSILQNPKQSILHQSNLIIIKL